jgi:hypothetical protein
LSDTRFKNRPRAGPRTSRGGPSQPFFEGSLDAGDAVNQIKLAGLERRGLMTERHYLNEFFNGRRPPPRTAMTRLVNAVLWLLIIGLLTALVLLFFGVL